MPVQYDMTWEIVWASFSVKLLITIIFWSTEQRIIYFPDLQDRFSEIKKIAKFLDVNYSDDQLQQLVDFMEINNFRQRVRIKSDSVEIKGIIADHTEEFIRNGK